MCSTFVALFSYNSGHSHLDNLQTTFSQLRLPPKSKSCIKEPIRRLKQAIRKRNNPEV